MSEVRAGGLRAMGRAAILAAFAALAVGIEAAPVGLSAHAMPSPDLLVCVVAYFVTRAPEAAPLLLVFALGLARDLLTDVPPGLGALSLVLATEILRGRRAMLARQPFVVEWLWFALAVCAMAAMQWIGVLLSLDQPPYLADLGRHLAATLFIYPLIVVFCRGVLGFRAVQSDPA